MQIIHKTIITLKTINHNNIFVIDIDVEVLIILQSHNIAAVHYVGGNQFVLYINWLHIKVIFHGRRL